MRSGNTTFYNKAKSSTLTLKDVFSDVFKKHSIRDGERIFIAGTSLSTPSPENMLLDWKKPWLFVRVLFVGLFVLFLFKFMITQGFGLSAIAPYIFFTASVMPVAILLLYWEMNIPRNIPIYTVIIMFMVGGILSLILTGYLSKFITISQACWAPITEEPAKLLASLVPLIFIKKMKRTYILNGILIGGAIGAGFAAIETAGYINKTINIAQIIEIAKAQDITKVMDIANVVGFGEKHGLIRGLLAPGGHVVWAAIYVGALTKVIGPDEFKLEHLANVFFLKFFFSACVLHFLWNSEISLLPLPYFCDLRYILLTIAAWVLLLQIFRYGIQEVLCITSTGKGNAAVFNEKNSGVSTVSAKLIGIAGIFNEQSFPMKRETIVLGRDASICNLVFPENAKGISKKHCSITFDGSRITVRDEGSTYGTFLGSGQKLRVGEVVTLSSGQRFYLANQNNMFEANY